MTVFCGISDREAGRWTDVYFYVKAHRPRFRKICQECLDSSRMGLYLLNMLAEEEQ